MDDLVLTGLDGSNPLAFLAALGVLRVLTEAAEREGGALPQMGWRDAGAWRPCLRGVGTMEDVVATLDRDRAARRDAMELSLAYNEGGELVSPDAPKATRDLKPPPATLRRWLQAVAQAGDRRAQDLAAAFAPEGGLDRSGKAKPSALHFTAGQQAFLGMCAQLAEGVRVEHLEEALVGPWEGRSPLPSLSWDATVARLYALRAGNPALEKRGSVAGADWLAFVGLSAFPVAAGRRGETVTTGCTGTWKEGTFTWPLWEGACGWGEARSLIGLPDLEEEPPDRRAARGICAVYAAEIGRSEQGGYGSFRPSRVC